MEVRNSYLQVHFVMRMFAVVTSVDPTRIVARIVANHVVRPETL